MVKSVPYRNIMRCSFRTDLPGNFSVKSGSVSVLVQIRQVALWDVFEDAGISNTEASLRPDSVKSHVSCCSI
ncbi:hypothetical protein PSSHI_28210 [Photobacterium sp. R1]